MSPVVARNSSQMAVQLGLQQIEGTLGKNPERGMEMLVIASEKRNEEAIRSLVAIHGEGCGAIPANREQAVFWFEKLKHLYQEAAAQGNIDSMWALGKLLLDDSLEEEDCVAAERQCVLVAESGRVDYMHALGMLYAEGAFGDENPDEAHRWIQQAVVLWSEQKGNSHAARCVGEVHYDGDLGQPNYEEAIRWFTQAADLGDEESLCYLAKIYLGLQGAEYKDLAKGAQLIARIVDAQTDGELTVEALRLLPHLREPDNIDCGLKWFTDKALKGQTVEQLLESGSSLPLLQKQALWDLAAIYGGDESDAARYEKAGQLLSLLARTGDRSALTRLVDMHQKGYLRDPAKATQLAEALISKLDSKGIEEITSHEALILGRLYKAGAFIQKDVGKAAKFLCVALCLAKTGERYLEAERELQEILSCATWTVPEIDQIMTGLHSLTSVQSFLKVVSRLLGDVYSTDIIIDKDTQEAVRWYTISAGLGNSKARAALEKLAAAS